MFREVFVKTIDVQPKKLKDFLTVSNLYFSVSFFALLSLLI